MGLVKTRRLAAKQQRAKAGMKPLVKKGGALPPHLHKSGDKPAADLPRPPDKCGEIPEEAVGEAIVNALIHRNWHSSGSVEIRLFADRLEVWSPGHLPPDITIPELYKEHDSHPVNKEILKAFDKINVIESLGTGIERMIAACHASGLPTPVFEYHGSAFVVTILKDAWTRTALESLDLNPDQIKAVSYVKVNGWISLSRYAELYKVPMRTSSRELGELAHKGVFVLVGKGRQSRYELKSNRARIAPIAPNAEQSAKPLKINGKSKVNLGLSPQTSREAAQETAQENLSAEESIIVDCIKARDYGGRPHSHGQLLRRCRILGERKTERQGHSSPSQLQSDTSDPAPSLLP